MSHGGLDSFGEVVPEVPPVGDLDRFGCAGSGAFGVGAGPVATDDLYSGVLAQPCGECDGFPIGKDIDGSVRVQIDEYGRVDLAAA
jgi:hypothetical protein